MSDFDRAIETCLDRIRDGSWSVEDCLRAFPRQADALRPQLLTAAAVQRAYSAHQPRPEFAERARERFVVATGAHLRDAYDIEPSPSFFAAARVRFLMAAHLMKREGRLRPAREQRRPMFLGSRGLLAAGVALAMLLSASSYTVASASSALPGDWRYSIKLETERVRLALAFSASDKRDVRLDIASERASEIKRLARQGHRIGRNELARLSRQTASLAQDASQGDWDGSQLARLQNVSEQANVALQQAAPQVEPDAQPQLLQAVSASQQALTVAAVQIVQRRDVVRLQPSLLQTAMPQPTQTPQATGTPPAQGTPTLTPGGSATPEGTPTGFAPTATPTSPAPRPTGIAISSPELTGLGILWKRVSAGNVDALIPDDKDGWHVSGIDYAARFPTLLHVTNVDGTSLLVIDLRNGDMYWYQAINGQFDEIDMRTTNASGQTFVQDPAVLHAAYGALADIPLFVMNSIEVMPPATPTPAPTSTPSR
jgi:hypothetical protein